MLDPSTHEAIIERLAQALQQLYYDIPDKYGKVPWDLLVEARKERWRHVARHGVKEFYKIAVEVSQMPPSNVVPFEQKESA